MRRYARRELKYNLRGRLESLPVVATIPATSAGSLVQLNAYEATEYLNIDEGMGGAAIDFYLRMVCDYANRWHQRKDPTRQYTTVGVSNLLDVVLR